MYIYILYIYIYRIRNIYIYCIYNVVTRDRKAPMRCSIRGVSNFLVGNLLKPVHDAQLSSWHISPEIVRSHNLGCVTSRIKRIKGFFLRISSRKAGESVFRISMRNLVPRHDVFRKTTWWRVLHSTATPCLSKP